MIIVDDLDHILFVIDVFPSAGRLVYPIGLFFNMTPSDPDQRSNKHEMQAAHQMGAFYQNSEAVEWQHSESC